MTLIRLVGKFRWMYVLIKIALWEVDGPSGLARTPKWPKKLVGEAAVEIEPIWISLGLVGKLLKKLEESGNHLNAGFPKIDAETICIPCVVFHLRKCFIRTIHLSKSDERNGERNLCERITNS